VYFGEEAIHAQMGLQQLLSSWTRLLATWYDQLRNRILTSIIQGKRFKRNEMAKKKPRKLSKRQKRKLRLNQLLFVTIAFVMIATVLVGLIR
jgi:hypothetical protein